MRFQSAAGRSDGGQSLPADSETAAPDWDDDGQSLPAASGTEAPDWDEGGQSLPAGSDTDARGMTPSLAAGSAGDAAGPSFAGQSLQAAGSDGDSACASATPNGLKPSVAGLNDDDLKGLKESKEIEQTLLQDAVADASMGRVDEDCVQD